MSEQRGNNIPPGDDPMFVNVLVGFSEARDGRESEPIYERHRLNRPANYRFEEPLDLSEPEPIGGSVLAEHQQYQSERERLKTFDGKWTSEYHVTKEDLAKDGFIYKGPGDRVMCVFCLKSIRKWDRQDTVPGEHKRLYPHCPWVRGKANHMNIPISERERVRQDIGVSRKGLPLNTDMITTAARLKTFNRWQARKIMPSTLVEAGFFYADDNQILTCYHCGMEVRAWDVESVFQRHAEGSPSCPMVQHSQSNGEHNFAPEVTLAAPNDPSHEQGASWAGAQNLTVNIDADMNSPAVQAVVEYGDYDMEEIRNAVEKLRVSKGSGHISSQDIMEKLDPDINNMDY